MIKYQWLFFVLVTLPVRMGGKKFGNSSPQIPCWEMHSKADENIWYGKVALSKKLWRNFGTDYVHLAPCLVWFVSVSCSVGAHNHQSNTPWQALRGPSRWVRHPCWIWAKHLLWLTSTTSRQRRPFSTVWGTVDVAVVVVVVVAAVVVVVVVVVVVPCFVSNNFTGKFFFQRIFTISLKLAPPRPVLVWRYKDPGSASCNIQRWRLVLAPTKVVLTVPPLLFSLVLFEENGPRK